MHVFAKYPSLKGNIRESLLMAPCTSVSPIPQSHLSGWMEIKTTLSQKKGNSFLHKNFPLVFEKRSQSNRERLNLNDGPWPLIRDGLHKMDNIGQLLHCTSPKLKLISSRISLWAIKILKFLLCAKISETFTSTRYSYRFPGDFVDQRLVTTGLHP